MTASLASDERDVAAPGPSQGRRVVLRRLALLALLVVAALLLVGSLKGDDDAFPFGPFRMYSTANAPGGTITSITLEKRLDGATAWTRVTDGQIGMRRAEYEGQWRAIVADPSKLGDLAATYDGRHPGRAAVTDVRLVRTTSQLVNRQVSASSREILATWTAS